MFFTVPVTELVRLGYSLDEMDVDGLVFDLDDKSRGGSTEISRARLHDFLIRRRPQYANTYVRISAELDSRRGEDLRLISAVMPDAVILSNISSVEALREMDAWAQDYKSKRKRELPFCLEFGCSTTLQTLDALFGTSQNVFLISSGYRTNSLSETSKRLLSGAVSAAKRHSVSVFDSVSPCASEQDVEQFRRETREGRKRGLLGRVARFPWQVDIVNEEYRQIPRNEEY